MYRFAAWNAVVVIVILLAFSEFAPAQPEPAAAPVPAPGVASPTLAIPDGPIKVKIITVQGIVQSRPSSDQKWEKAAEGAELSEGAELRTGPRSAVKFMIGDDQVISLDRLGTIQILRADFESGKVFTDLGMKYGRTRYDIDSAAHEHEAKVRSPSAVLAVRGTQFDLSDQAPFPPRAVSLNGRVQFHDAHKQVTVGAKGEGPASVTTQVDSPAALALNTSFIAPGGQFVGRTPTENQRITTNLNILNAVQGGGPPSPPPPPPQPTPPPPTPPTPIPTPTPTPKPKPKPKPKPIPTPTGPTIIPQILDFSGFIMEGPPGADLVLGITTPSGKLVDRTHPLAGTIYQDGPPILATSGGTGTRGVVFQNQFEAGTYGITATLLNSQGPLYFFVSVSSTPPNDAAKVTTYGSGSIPFTLSGDVPTQTQTLLVDGNPTPAVPSGGDVLPQSVQDSPKAPKTAKKPPAHSALPAMPAVGALTRKR